MKQKGEMRNEKGETMGNENVSYEKEIMNLVLLIGFILGVGVSFIINMTFEIIRIF